MKPKLLLLAAMLLTAVSAQAQAGNPAIKDSTARQTSQPAEGGTSFTEAQAKGRLADAGYTSMSKLTKSKDGMWMGTASKGGKKVEVALDYTGNVSTR